LIFVGGDFSRLQRDLSLHRREKSRFRPLYYSYCRLVQEAKLGEIAAHINRTSSTSTELPQPPSAALRRPTPPPAVNGSHSSWQCRRGLPHSGGKACQYFCWWPGPSSKEAFVWEGRPAGARWRSVYDRSLPPSRRAACIYPRCRSRSRRSRGIVHCCRS
jgi:hypothetical protein